MGRPKGAIGARSPRPYRKVSTPVTAPDLRFRGRGPENKHDRTPTKTAVQCVDRRGVVTYASELRIDSSRASARAPRADPK
jgi:hypothetical protein